MPKEIKGKKAEAAAKAAPEAGPPIQEAPEAGGEPAPLQEQLQEKTKEAEENYHRVLRLAAEMENLKKRTEKERAELLQFANENLVKELLPVVDNLELALDHGRGLETPAPLLEGLERVHLGFLKALEKFGVSPISSVGQPFDPAVHNAVMQEEAPEVPDCTVLKELQKGYLMHQRLIRPAMVVVARNPEKPADETVTTHQEET